jgi:hypothetical protein
MAEGDWTFEEDLPIGAKLRVELRRIESALRVTVSVDNRRVRRQRLQMHWGVLRGLSARWSAPPVDIRPSETVSSGPTACRSIFREVRVCPWD